MTRRIGYHTLRVRSTDGRVGRVEAVQAGLVRVAFRGGDERLIPKHQLSAARNDRDQLKTEPRKPATRIEAPMAKSIYLLAVICQELGIKTRVARRKLRKANLRAPYDNETAIRVALG